MSSLSVIAGTQVHTGVATVTPDEADLTWVTSPTFTAPRVTLLIRMMAGAVFLSEGILKFATRTRA